MAEDDDRHDSDEVRERNVASGQAVVCQLIRKRLAQEGIDPALVRALRAINLPAAGDRGRDDSGQPDELNKEFGDWEADGLADAFGTKIGAIMDTYRDGQLPDFANASLAEVFAWSLLPNARNQ